MADEKSGVTLVEMSRDDAENWEEAALFVVLHTCFLVFSCCLTVRPVLMGLKSKHVVIRHERYRFMNKLSCVGLAPGLPSEFKRSELL